MVLQGYKLFFSNAKIILCKRNYKANAVSIYKNNFKISENIFYKENKFKGKIGIFEINKNIITHQLNFYSIENEQFKKIF